MGLLHDLQSIIQSLFICPWRWKHFLIEEKNSFKMFSFTKSFMSQSICILRKSVRVLVELFYWYELRFCLKLLTTRNVQLIQGAIDILLFFFTFSIQDDFVLIVIMRRLVSLQLFYTIVEWFWRAQQNPIERTRTSEDLHISSSKISFEE